MQENSMNPFFSVIIPTYNRSQELKRSVESVLSQSFGNFEILVMDDGSTDDTQKVVSTLNDPRIIYDWEKNFGGPARPRNRGVAKARGEWICFLDADDTWLPYKLEACYQHIDERVDFIYNDLEINEEKKSLFNKSIRRTRQLKKPVIMDLLLNDNAISNSSVVVRKNILDRIGKIDEKVEMIASEDYNTWLRIASITDKFLYIKKVLGCYAVTESNISGRNMMTSVKSAREKYIHLLTKSENDRFMSRIEYLTARRAYKCSVFDIAKPNFKFSLKHGDFMIKIKSAYFIANIIIIQNRNK